MKADDVLLGNDAEPALADEQADDDITHHLRDADPLEEPGAQHAAENADAEDKEQTEMKRSQGNTLSYRTKIR